MSPGKMFLGFQILLAFAVLCSVLDYPANPLRAGVMLFIEIFAWMISVYLVYILPRNKVLRGR